MMQYRFQLSLSFVLWYVIHDLIHIDIENILILVYISPTWYVGPYISMCIWLKRTKRCPDFTADPKDDYMHQGKVVGKEKIYFICNIFSHCLRRDLHNINSLADTYLTWSKIYVGNGVYKFSLWGRRFTCETRWTYRQCSIRKLCMSISPEWDMMSALTSSCTL